MVTKTNKTGNRQARTFRSALVFKKPRLFLRCLLPCMAVLMLGSCLGASMDITVRENGSGRIVLEYRVSQMLESIGRLDGNKDWPAIPVGREDFERSVARIPGLRLSSFSAREAAAKPGSAADLVTRAVLDFDDTTALLAFLDRTGSRASLVQENGKNTMRLVLVEPGQQIQDEQLLSLMQEVSSGYEISITVNAPKNVALAVLPQPVSQARTGGNGRTASFAAGTSDLPGLSELALEFSW